jgi:hypothetical protein
VLSAPQSVLGTNYISLSLFLVFERLFIVCFTCLYISYTNDRYQATIMWLLFIGLVSVISWRSVLLVEETGAPGETSDLSQVVDKLYHIMLYYTSPWSRFELTTSVVIGTGARGTELTPPPPFFLTFCLHIYFQYNFFISLLFHLFFLILTCSCQYIHTILC